MQYELISEDKLTISGEEIDVKIGNIPQSALKYYSQNPRVYSIVYSKENEPSQELIEKELCSLDRIKQLVNSIKANGGLLDPLIVRDGDFVVLEGNSRLAAYRILSKNDPIKWGKVKCKILSSEIDDNLIFKLLGQYHIIGRKDWVPFEQAGYLWRRNKNYNISFNEMAKEMGLTISKIERLIEVYSFMLKHNDVKSQNWSYYEEYLHSRPINRKRKQFSDLDKVVVGKIKTGEMSNALVDIRNLVNVAKINGKKGEKILKNFIENKKSLEECCEVAKELGVENSIYNKLFNFRKFICVPDIIREFKKMPKVQLQKCEYELKKIKARNENLVEKVSVMKEARE